MESSFDIFLTCLPRDVNEVVIKNLFRTVGNVIKVKIIDDKKNENCKLCFVGFSTMDEAMEGVRLADRSTAFGEPIKASISRKSLENYDQKKPAGNDFKKSFNNDSENSRGLKSFGESNDFSASNDDSKGFNSLGRGRGAPPKKEMIQPSFTSKSVHLTDIKLKTKEMIDLEIIDLSNLEYICARPLKHTETSKAEITEILVAVNKSTDDLKMVDEVNVGDCYLGKWDDGQYYRAELLEKLSDGKYKVTFVDEGTSGDIVSEIRKIPEGPLQQYPKQFTKVCLGCKNSEDLREFIISESDGKKVSLYWLGGFNNDIPLINLFLSEEEIVEKFILLKRIHIRESFSLKFKDMPNHTSDTDCSEVSIIQPLFRSVSDFTVTLRAPSTFKCEKKSPLILPVPGDICIYEKRSGSTISFMRCVIKRRQLFAFDILLFDIGEHLNAVSIDCLYAAEDSHKMQAPSSIICELDGSLGCNDSSFLNIMGSDNKKFTIVTYKGNNKYLVKVVSVEKAASKYPGIVLKNFMGKVHKVLVTHVVSPLNFYVQIDKSDYVQTLNSIHEKLNLNYSAPRFSNLDDVKVGQALVAPFSVEGGEGENFRAIVLEKRQQSPQVHVFYVDYGNDNWVDYKQLIVANADITATAGLAINCALDVDVKKEASNHAIELFSKLVGFIDDDGSELTMEAKREAGDILIIDLTSMVKGSITAALDKSGTCTIKGVAPPMCNGTNKSVRESPVKKQDVPSPAASNDDFVALLKKVADMEQRLAYLEKKVLQ